MMRPMFGALLDKLLSDLIILVFVGAVGVGDVLPSVEANLKKNAARVLENAKQMCSSKSVKISSSSLSAIHQNDHRR